MNLVIFFGPPGCGKGTQADFIRDKFSLKKISTGDALRAIAAKGTELGNNVSKLMKQGALIPDETVSQVVVASFNELDSFAGAILDGYPRTLNQAKFLSDYLNNHARKLFTKIAVIEFKIADELLVDRVVGRYICKNCGATYHKQFCPTKVKNVCDVCQSQEFFTRDDDKAEIVTQRIATYHENFKAIKQFYQGQGIYEEINADNSIPEIQQAVTHLIQK